MRLPRAIDPDRPFDERPEVGPDGLTERQRRSDRLARRLLVPLALVFLALFLVFFVFFDFGRVDGDSMVPTLLDEERTLITRGLAQPRRGDIVVVAIEEGGVPGEMVKRVVALAGDRVSFTGDRVTVNGAPEAFRHGVVIGPARGPSATLVVPAGHIFVMGDNRPVSLDSRFTGPVRVADVHGKVVAVYSPVTRIRAVPGP